MTASGPGVEALTRRLLDTPADFLDPTTEVTAVVSDLFVSVVGSRPRWVDRRRLPPRRHARGPQLVPRRADRDVAARRRLVRDITPPVATAGAVLTGAVRELAAAVPAETLVSDADRREELARRLLAGLGLLPAGETDAQATDRLAAPRLGRAARVLAATRAAEERAAAVRQAMHDKAAAEAAAKASRE